MQRTCSVICLVIAFATALSAQQAVSISLPGGACGDPPPVMTIDPPQIGQTITLNITTAFPNAPLFLFYSYGQIPPFPVPGFPCIIHVDFMNPANLFQVNLMTDANGNYTTDVDIPFDVSVVGLEATLQARVWAPGGPIPEGDHLGNGVFIRFGQGGGEGCTPGYWKQSQHFHNWTEYTPQTLFSDVFEDAFPGETLLEVLEEGGGQLDALGRHAVAALLNGRSPAISYNRSRTQVINMFNMAFPGTDPEYEALKDMFDLWNNQGCSF